MVGYAVENLKSNAQGIVDVAALSAQMNEEVAALMLTNPNTLGVFEQEIHKIAEIMHAKGGLLYMDGANMNALVGKVRPGDFGVDVMHLNLHKTFSTPHGGGGPGSGPVAVKQILEPFLPKPVLVTKPDGTLAFDYDRPQSVGRVRAFYGNFGMFVRALAYILANGPDGLRQTTEDAVLNANYIRKGLEGVYDLPYSTPSMHEVVFSDKLQAKKGVKTMDIAKRLIDYGFHPYTTAFPLIVPGAMMIEPTESESVEEMDLFIEAMKSIAEEVEEDPQMVLDAPHTTRVSRLDETAAARKPVLRWKPGRNRNGQPRESKSDMTKQVRSRNSPCDRLCPLWLNSFGCPRENLQSCPSNSRSLFSSPEKRNVILCLLLVVATLALVQPGQSPSLRQL